MRILLLIILLITIPLNATSVQPDILKLNDENLEYLGFSISKYKFEQFTNCREVLISKKYKDSNQLSLELGITDKNGDAIFKGMIASQPYEDDRLVKYNFCLPESAAKVSAIILYGHSSTMLVSTIIEVPDEYFAI